MEARNQTQMVLAALAVGFVVLGVLVVVRTKPSGRAEGHAGEFQTRADSAEARGHAGEFQTRAVSAEARLEDVRADRDAIEAKLRETRAALSEAETAAAVANQAASSLRDRLDEIGSEASAELVAARATVEEARTGTLELAKACVLQLRRAYDSARKAHGSNGAEMALAAEMARAMSYSWCASLTARLHEKLGGTGTSEVDVIEEGRKARVAYEMLTEGKK